MTPGAGDPILDDGYDQINVIGELTLAGILDIVLINDFTPTAGNEFIIFTFGALAGGFETINGLDFAESCSSNYVVNDNNITLVTQCLEQIIATVQETRVPEPGMQAIFGFGLVGVGAIRRRRRA